MNYKIGITGTGGGVGQSILKSLYNTEYEIVSLDGEFLGTGLYAAPISYIIPYASEPDFISKLIDICIKENISLLFPGLDAELSRLSLNYESFKAVGTTVVVSSKEVIDISDNKQLMYDRLKNIGVNFPVTSRLKDLKADQIRFPLIIKQMIGGTRSKNVYLVNNNSDLDSVTNRINDKYDNFIVQEYIEGDEYTCGTINLDNVCMGVIIMRRILRDGDTYKCFTEENPVIEDAVREVVKAIKPFGACNIQLRMKEGKPYILEINARCSGTTAARSLCGFNEPKMIADYILYGIKPEFKILQQTVLRYWKEFIVENETVDILKKHKGLKINNTRFL